MHTARFFEAKYMIQSCHQCIRSWDFFYFWFPFRTALSCHAEHCSLTSEDGWWSDHEGEWGHLSHTSYDITTLLESQWCSLKVKWHWCFAQLVQQSLQYFIWCSEAPKLTRKRPCMRPCAFTARASISLISFSSSIVWWFAVDRIVLVTNCYILYEVSHMPRL